MVQGRPRAPPPGAAQALWEWFDEHPDGYDYFRARYHGDLAQSKYKPALRQLAQAGARETFTLLHPAMTTSTTPLSR